MLLTSDLKRETWNFLMKQLSEEYTETLTSLDDATSRSVGDAKSETSGDHDPPEVREARALALRYRLPYVDLLPP